MKVRRQLLPVVALVGCRLDFSLMPGSDADESGSQTTDAKIDAHDAPAFGPLGTVNKLSIDQPLIQVPQPGPGVCGEFAIAFASQDNMLIQTLTAYVVVDPRDNRFWLFYPCKDTGSGWSIALADWQPGRGEQPHDVVGTAMRELTFII